MNRAGLDGLQADALDEVAGLPLLDFIAPESRDACAALQARVLAGQSAIGEYDGICIPADQRQRLFEPFTQLDAFLTRNQGGAGLGLSISRSLAVLMGGELDLESEPGKGSTFWFSIRAEILAAAPPEETEPMLAEGHDASLRGKRVLLVEDNEVNRKVVEAMLARLGPRVSHAKHGQAVLDALSEARRRISSLWTARCRSWTATRPPAVCRSLRRWPDAHTCRWWRLPPTLRGGSATLPGLGHGRLHQQAGADR